MKKIILTAIAILALIPAHADEGMWLPSLIAQRFEDMKAKGFKLTPEDLYSINQASLKDAVVLFGRGCTGEVVSEDGLLFTNHHCGYSYIQKHSSVEHDYLKDGFWAMNRGEELPNPGLSVSFLERMDDVTAVVLKGVEDGMSKEETDAIIKENSERLKKEAVAGRKGLKASVEALYYSNCYYLFLFKEYTDVRLVGAPPSSIGKFGGDTDNWMWPRHTGDFSVFRIYADADNEPAEYSENNVPYHPRKFFTISRKGVQEGDFTFIYGCPGSTQEYIMSDAVDFIANLSDPLKIKLREVRLMIMEEFMSDSQEVRIQYSAKYANVANAWKKWQGESLGIKRNRVVEKKMAYEAEFQKWADANGYGHVLPLLSIAYDEYFVYAFLRDLYIESVYSFELGRFATSLASYKEKRPEQVSDFVDSFYKDYNMDIDIHSTSFMLYFFKEELSDLLRNVDKPELNLSYQEICVPENEPEYNAMLHLFERSALLDKEKVLEMTAEEVRKDPAYIFFDGFYTWYHEKVYPEYDRLSKAIEMLYHDYMRAQMEFSPEKQFYPDANLTLRVAYGHVEGYEPADGMYYSPVSTLKGIIEKDDPDVFDYDIPQTLREIYAEGGHDDQPVCFLATNHTTGGNSGSPVLNGDGELIGINFDRVWEGTMSDIAFDPAFCRNISLDVRYLLFVIDKIGGASYLFDEMVFN